MKQQLLNEKRAFRFKRFARKAYSVFNSMHKLVNIGVLSSCMLMFAYNTETTAQTQETIKQSGMDGKELEEVTVTASRMETTQEQAARIVTVITRAEIERSPVQSVQDLLKYVSGIDVRQRGPNGVQSDISLRGGTSDQIVLLLNGANLTNPQTGHYSFDIPVNLSDIERIEIIQGPSTLIYGAGAFAGGINIVTKKNAETTAVFNLEGGMHKLYDIEAGGAYHTGDFTHRLSAGYTASDGYMRNSDYKILNTLWQSRIQQQKTTVDFQLGFNDKKYGANTFYSPKYPDQYDAIRSIFSSLRGTTGDRVKFIPQIYWNRHYDRYELIRGENANYHRSDVYGFNLNLQFTSVIGITNIGGEFRNEGILSNVLGIPMNTARGNYTKSDNRSNVSYFIEQNVSIKRLQLSAGILASHNTSIEEDFRFYPSVNASYRISTPFRIYASWSKSLRMPTFTDLYYKTPTHQGNPDLLPEQAESFELGLKFRNRLLTAHVNTFLMKGKDVIDWVRKIQDGPWESMNFSELDKTGFETGFFIPLKEIFPVLAENNGLSVSYTFLHQNKKSEDTGSEYILDSNYALDYLKHKVTVRLDHKIRKGFSAHWEFRWQERLGEYEKYIHSTFAGRTTYQPYSILDLKLNWAWKQSDVYCILNNLFNVTYNDLGNIPQPGFWLVAGVKLTIR